MAQEQQWPEVVTIWRRLHDGALGFMPDMSAEDKERYGTEMFAMRDYAPQDGEVEAGERLPDSAEIRAALRALAFYEQIAEWQSEELLLSHKLLEDGGRRAKEARVALDAARQSAPPSQVGQGETEPNSAQALEEEAEMAREGHDEDDWKSPPGLLEKLEAEIAELRDGAAIYRKQAEEAAERDEYSHEASRCEAYADARDNAADRLTRLIDSERSGSE